MDPLPSKDQGIVPSQPSPERAEGIADTPTHPKSPQYDADEDAPNRRKSGGVSVLLIVLIVLGVFGLGGVALVGGLVLAGGMLFFTFSASVPPAPPSALAPMVVPIQNQPLDRPVAKPPQKVEERPLDPPAPPNKAEKGKDGALRKDKQP